jgi:hypothetical protein
MGSGCTDPLILDLDSSWRQMVSFMPWSVYPPEPVWTLWRRENSEPYQDMNSTFSVIQPVASLHNDFANPAPVRPRLLIIKKLNDEAVWC